MYHGPSKRMKYHQWITLCWTINYLANNWCITAQKKKFSIKDFFSKCDQIRSFLRIWSHLMKKFLMENFIFCALYIKNNKDPNMEPWETPTLTTAHKEFWSFSICLCFRSDKMSFSSLRRTPEKSDSFNLKIKPLYHTSSKDLKY